MGLRGAPDRDTTLRSQDASGRDEPIDEVPIPAKGSLLLGKYRVEGIVGFGGMGVVISARHELLGDRVAMKVLLPTHARDPETRARFTREAQAAFLLKSEHVCRVLDAGELEDGTPFIAMEYLKGEDIGARIRRTGKLPLEQACELVLQACDAIAEAHANEIVHRDLKPSNLVVVKRKDGSPCVKVIDFGISKLGVSRVVEATSSATKTYAYLGSPIYSAPEHLEAARSATARSDQWSLAVVLYQSLTAEMPFEFTDDAVWSVTAIVQKASPIPMRARDPSIPAELDAAVLRCLEKDPLRRFASVQAFARAIAPFAGPNARDILARVENHALLDTDDTVAIAGAFGTSSAKKDERVTKSQAPPARPGFAPPLNLKATPVMPPRFPTPMPMPPALSPTRMYSSPLIAPTPRGSGVSAIEVAPPSGMSAGLRIALAVLALGAAGAGGAMLATRAAKTKPPPEAAATTATASATASATVIATATATADPTPMTTETAAPSASPSTSTSATAKTRVRTKPVGSGPTFLKNRNGE